MPSDLRRTSLPLASETAQRFCHAVDAAMAEVGWVAPRWQPVWENDHLIIVSHHVPNEICGGWRPNRDNWWRSLGKAVLLAEPAAAPRDVLYALWEDPAGCQPTDLDLINVQQWAEWALDTAEIIAAADMLHGRA